MKKINLLFASMKKINLLFASLLLTLTTSLSFAQVGIGTTNPHPSAILELDVSPANDKGLLLPRLTTPERDAISSPAEGLVIYNKDNKCLEFRSDVDWINVCNSNGGSSIGPGTNNITGGITAVNDPVGTNCTVSVPTSNWGAGWQDLGGSEFTLSQTRTVRLGFTAYSGHTRHNRTSVPGTVEMRSQIVVQIRLVDADTNTPVGTPRTGQISPSFTTNHTTTGTNDANLGLISVGVGTVSSSVPAGNYKVQYRFGSTDAQVGSSGGTPTVFNCNPRIRSSGSETTTIEIL